MTIQTILELYWFELTAGNFTGPADTYSHFIQETQSL